MKKQLVTLSAIILSLLTIFSSCGSKSYDMAEADTVSQNNYAVVEEAKDEAPKGFVSTGGTTMSVISDGMTYTDDSESSTSYVPEAVENRKIIYSSSYNIQATEFEEALSVLDILCQKYGAYYENSETYGTKENANRNGSFTVRVPVENYNAFKNEAGSIGVVIRSSENNLDVTENYIDTEARLQSATVREERLLEILANADSLDDVLLLEKELADVRYEIESMSGSLRKYDSLINYSTIEIYIREVIEPVVIKPVPKTFSQKVSLSLSEGLDDFSRDAGNLFLDILYNLPGIIIFIVTIVIICVIIKVVIGKNKKKKANNVKNEEVKAEESKE